MTDSGGGRMDHTTDGADGSCWDAGLEDDSGPVMKAVGRQIKAWREAAGLKQAEFGAAIGYGEEMVSAVERGRRVPKPEFLDNADRVLERGRRSAALRTTWREARYPKRCGTLPGWRRSRRTGRLRQPQHARPAADRGVRTGAVPDRPPASGRRPRPLRPARMARQTIFDRTRRHLTFVQEEVTLRGRSAGRRCCADSSTLIGYRAVAARRDPGHADRPRGPCGDGR